MVTVELLGVWQGDFGNSNFEQPYQLSSLIHDKILPRVLLVVCGKFTPFPSRERGPSLLKKDLLERKKLHPTAWFASSYCFSPGRGGFSCSNPETVQSSLGNGANHKIVEPSLMSVLFYSFLERSSESEPSHGRVNDAEFMVLCLFFGV